MEGRHDQFLNHESSMGCLLCSNNYSVIIVGGQHRVSTLIYLGCKTIPVIFSKSYPPIVNLEDIDNWPYVKAGIIKRNDAVDIFNSYFK